MILSFQGYSFCKPHSASYALVSLAKRHLSEARIGLFGYPALGIYTATADHVSLRQKIGPEIFHLDQWLIVKGMDEVAEKEAIAFAENSPIGEIEECAAVMGQSLSERDLNEVKSYRAFLDGRICTLCGGCAGECPYGVPYGDLLRAVMYHDGYQNNGLAEETLEKRALLKEIKTCSDCPSCSIVCRRGLDLKTQIKLAEKY
jgi:ferredoxin